MKLVAAFAFLAVMAQADQPSYEVVSVKVSDSRSNGISGYAGIRPGGAVSLRNVTLHFLIGMAYELPDYRISGGPAWIETLRYHVDAKPSSSVSKSVARRMMQTLLADRFRLQVHHENKIVGGYRLTAPKSDAKMVKLSPNDAIGFRFMQPGRIEGHGTTAMLVNTLQAILGAPVDDATGLTGAYDMSLEWTLDETIDDGKPSIFSALNERLGLVLKGEKVPIDVLVIDHAEKPDAN
jgi:uncharacterized protein (TIGR03435 family)